MADSLLTIIQSRNSTLPLSTATAPVFKLKKVPEINDNGIACPIEEKLPAASLEDIKKFKILDTLVVKLQENFKLFNKVQKKRKLDGSVSHKSKLEVTPNMSHIVESYISSSLRKCLDCKAFWSPNGFKTIIDNNLITKRSHGLMFECMFKYKNYDGLDFFANKGQMVEEKFLVQIIKTVISEIPKEYIKTLSDVVTAQQCPIDDQYASNLLKVVTLQFDQNNLQEHLKLLTADESLVFFHFLHYLLLVTSPALMVPTDITLEIPQTLTETQIMSWIDCLMTAKLSVFIASPSLQHLTVMLKKTMRKQGMFYNHISTLAPYLNQIKSKSKVSENKIGLYKIETINL